jgi:hypothetical protein
MLSDTPTTEARLLGLLRLLDNRQMPDDAQPKVSLGDLRALRAEAVRSFAERVRDVLDRLAREAHGKGYTDSDHVRYVGPGPDGEATYAQWTFEGCPHVDCVEARALLQAETPDASDSGEGGTCPGPDCPYCAGEMCARFDGLGCTHDVIERHGYREPRP